MRFPLRFPLRAKAVRLRAKAVRRRMRTASPLRIGVITVIIMAVLLVGTVFVNSLQLTKATYRAEFEQAAGIAAGDSVTYAGVPIGSVSGTRLAGDRVIVTMKIDRSAKLGEDTRASIKLTTLLGTRYVEMLSNGIGEVPDKTITMDKTTVPYTLETALQDATSTFEDVDADQVAQSLTTLSQGLHGLPPLVPEVLRDVQALSAVISGRKDQIKMLLDSTEKVTTVLHDQQTDLASLVVEGRNVLQELMSRQDALRRMLRATTSLVQQIEPIVVDDQAQVQQLLDDLRAMTDMLAKNDALLRNLFEVLPVPWRMFANLTGSGNYLTANAPDGMFVDSFMCALSVRAVEMGRAPYREDCR